MKASCGSSWVWGRYVASLAMRSAASFPMDGISRFPVCEVTWTICVCGVPVEEPVQDAWRILMAVHIARIYGRAAQRRVEALSGLRSWWCMA